MFALWNVRLESQLVPAEESGPRASLGADFKFFYSIRPGDSSGSSLTPITGDGALILIMSSLRPTRNR